MNDRAGRHGSVARGVARAPAALAVSALLSAVVSCHRHGASRTDAPPLRLGHIEIRVVEGSDSKRLPIDVDALAQRLRTQFENSGLVITSPVDAGPPTPSIRVAGRVAVEVVEAERKGLCRAGISLAISTRPSDAPGALNDEISATGEERFDVIPGVDRAGIARRVVDRTAIDLLISFLRRTRLGSASPAEIHAAIAGDAGVALREAAIRVAGDRRLTAEAPILLSLLDDPDEPIRDAALGALISLRDQRAVTRLTRDRSLRDRREMLKTLEAVSQIGGSEAADYLSFVAESHDDPEIRQAAREARDRMTRRLRDAGERR